MRKENRKVLGIDKIKARNRKLMVEVFATMAINIVVEDPEDDPGADEEDLDKSEEQRWKDQFDWARSRKFETSTSREDFSDSLIWEELWEGR